MNKIPFLDLGREHAPILNELNEAVQRVIRRGSYILGEEVDSFETAFAAFVGVDHCIGCANGTDALELALAVEGIGVGDEVIVPANTWVSVAEAVVRIGARPVFADSLPLEYTIDPASVRRLISDDTRAVIVVHQYGTPARLNELLQIKNESRLVLIEDCAHAHGALYEGRRVGGFGDYGCFSFYPTKNLGALGDGGAITTTSDEKALLLRALVNHGQRDRNQHLIVGRNSRLDEMQAAVLRVKLRYLETWNSRRAETAQRYMKALQTSGLVFPVWQKEAFPVFHQFVIQTGSRDRLQRHLQAYGIGTAIHYPRLIPEIEPYGVFAKDALPVAESECGRILSLPAYPSLSESEQDCIVEAIMSCGF